MDDSVHPSQEKSPAYDYEDPAYRAFIDSLSYLAPDEVELIRVAYGFGEKAHRGQKRISGEPYITHPLAVASALTAWRMDAQAIAAALLHDVVEDTMVSKAQIAERFGTQIADLVDALSKLNKIEFRSYQAAQAENYHKMLMAMARDLRVVLIKLADRCHNLQTMAMIRPDKRRRIAKETLEIYVPIAMRLGLNNMARQLQDLSFEQIYPVRFRVLSRAVKAASGNRRELFGKILGGINEKLEDEHIQAEVFGREKSLYSIYRKMIEKRLSFSNVLDIYGFRVIVKDIATCYLALGALHARFKPVPGKFKDYIAIPKVNGYQSLHTTLIGPYGTPIEIQIRTLAMHHMAEEGIASHWRYKDSEEIGDDLQNKILLWLHSLLELPSAAGDPSEFLEHVKVDLFPDEVYVFTPKGKILALPRGATLIDFAYAVHTDIGHRCVAARIDHQLIPLSTELANGNQVEIITAPLANPNPAWLSYAKTSHARSRIRQFLRGTQQASLSALGEKMLEQELRALGMSFAEVSAEVWKRVIHESGEKNQQELYSNVALGRNLASVVAHSLAEHHGTVIRDVNVATPLLIRGTEGAAIQLASCCQPIPGDPIIGLLRKDQGLRVHTHTCPLVRKARGTEPQNWIRVEWAPDLDQSFEVRIKVMVKNVIGVLGHVATRIAEFNVNIDYAIMDRKKPGLYTDIHFQVQIQSRTHLASLMRLLRRIPEVIRIAREQDGERNIREDS